MIPHLRNCFLQIAKSGIFYGIQLSQKLYCLLQVFVKKNLTLHLFLLGVAI